MQAVGTRFGDRARSSAVDEHGPEGVLEGARPRLVVGERRKQGVLASPRSSCTCSLRSTTGCCVTSAEPPSTPTKTATPDDIAALAGLDRQLTPPPRGPRHGGPTHAQPRRIARSRSMTDGDHQRRPATTVPRQTGSSARRRQPDERPQHCERPRRRACGASFSIRDRRPGDDARRKATLAHRPEVPARLPTCRDRHRTVAHRWSWSGARGT